MSIGFSIIGTGVTGLTYAEAMRTQPAGASGQADSIPLVTW